MVGRLANKVAIVTGATRGIGRAIAFKLADEGADVVVTSRSLDRARETAARIEALGRRSLPVEVDVANWQSVSEMAKRVQGSFNSIDILVNNAGINKDNLLVRMGDEEWDTVLDTNLKGTFNCTKAVARVMMKQRSGRIVNITSVLGIIGNPGQANYTASKAGMIGLTKTTAKELASRGITVNAVAPGYIETEMTRGLPEQTKEAYLRLIPLARPGSTEDVAKVAAFLVSDEADYITGQVINVDGGLVM